MINMATRAMQLLVFAVAVNCMTAAADMITLENNSNFRVVLSTTGATIVKLLVPNCKSQGQVDVALGYDDEAGYGEEPLPSFGATVARVANRISNAQFTLDGATHKLLANDGNSSIHGGKVRWSTQKWTPTVSANKLSATFDYTSRDGESGFPGTVKAQVIYSIPANGTALMINMTATTDKATPLNIINHNYFNLKGAGNGDILDHVVQLPSLFFTPSPPPPDLVPTGQIFRVRDHPVYDFTTPKPIRQNLAQANGGAYKGYDTNYVLPATQNVSRQDPVWWLPGVNPQVAADQPTKALTAAAVVKEPTTGMRLRVYTNAPGVQFYSGNYLTGLKQDQPVPGKGGVYYKQYTGFCVEAQAFPDAINKPGFPSNVVRPGETFNNRITYEFGCAK